MLSAVDEPLTTSGTVADLGPQELREVEAELQRLTAQRAAYTHLAYLPFALGLSELTPLGSSHPLAHPLVVVVFLLSGARLWFARRSAGWSDEQFLNRRQLFRALVLASVLSFSLLLSIPLLTVGSAPLTLTTLIVLAGTIAGGISAVSADLVLSRLFSLIALLVPIALALGSSHPVAWGVPAALTLCVIFYQAVANQHYQQSFESVAQRVILRRQRADLLRANAEAEAAAIAKTQFLATISHELRTPMNGIIGMAELLMDGQLSEAQRDNAQTLRSSAEALLRIINDILDFAKIDTGKLQLEQLAYDPHALLLEVHRLLENVGRNPSVELLLNVSGSVPKAVLGDPTRLRQMLLNLGTNALKFTHKGHVTLGLNAIHRSSDEVELKFFVKDSGIGISSEQQQNIFKPFSQADASTARRYGGTGLGLSITSQLAELMGGQLLLESQQGRGSTFELVLPAKKTSMPSSGQQPNRTDVSLGLRALVVDDNAVNRKVAEKMLERLGAKVTLANGGEQACELASKAEYDIIFMDCMMPGMDGYAATGELRTRGVQTPIVALTANVRPEDREACLQAGMNDHLPKPIKLQDLVSTLRTNVPLARPSFVPVSGCQVARKARSSQDPKPIAKADS